MNFDYSPRQKEWMKRVGDFFEQHIYPAEEVYNAADGRGDEERQSLDRRACRGRAEEEGKGAGPVEHVPAAQRPRPRALPISNMRRWPK